MSTPSCLGALTQSNLFRKPIESAFGPESAGTPSSELPPPPMNGAATPATTAECATSLLAAADLPDPTAYASMGWIIAGLFGLVGLANQGMALWDRLFPRAMPPAHEVYATKAEVDELEKDRKEKMKRIEDRFSTWMEQNERQHNESMAELRKAQTTFSNWQLSIERALGDVETKADISLDSKTKS